MTFPQDTSELSVVNSISDVVPSESVILNAYAVETVSPVESLDAIETPKF